MVAMAQASSEPVGPTLTLDGVEATAALGRALASLARAGDVIALRGDLGVGKSELARGFVRALCGPDEDVPSPTFTLVQPYETAEFPLYHFDLYRLKEAEEAFELGIEDAFAEGVSLIEWPERLGSLLPARRLDVTLRMGARETQRIATLSGEAWADRLEKAGFHG